MSEIVPSIVRLTVVEELVTTFVIVPSVAVTASFDPLIESMVPRVKPPARPPGPPFAPLAGELDDEAFVFDDELPRLRTKIAPPAMSSVTTLAMIHVRADGPFFGAGTFALTT